MKRKSKKQDPAPPPASRESKKSAHPLPDELRERARSRVRGFFKVQKQFPAPDLDGRIHASLLLQPDQGQDDASVLFLFPPSGSGNVMDVSAPLMAAYHLLHSPPKTFRRAKILHNWSLTQDEVDRFEPPEQHGGTALDFALLRFLSHFFMWQSNENLRICPEVDTFSGPLTESVPPLINSGYRGLNPLTQKQVQTPQEAEECGLQVFWALNQLQMNSTQVLGLYDHYRQIFMIRHAYVSYNEKEEESPIDRQKMRRFDKSEYQRAYALAWAMIIQLVCKLQGLGPLEVDFGSHGLVIKQCMGRAIDDPLLLHKEENEKNEKKDQDPDKRFSSENEEHEGEGEEAESHESQLPPQLPVPEQLDQQEAKIEEEEKMSVKTKKNKKNSKLPSATAPAPASPRKANKKPIKPLPLQPPPPSSSPPEQQPVATAERRIIEDKNRKPSSLLSKKEQEILKSESKRSELRPSLPAPRLRMSRVMAHGLWEGPGPGPATSIGPEQVPVQETKAMPPIPKQVPVHETKARLHPDPKPQSQPSHDQLPLQEKKRNSKVQVQLQLQPQPQPSSDQVHLQETQLKRKPQLQLKPKQDPSPCPVPHPHVVRLQVRCRLALQKQPQPHDPSLSIYSLGWEFQTDRPNSYLMCLESVCMDRGMDPLPIADMLQHIWVVHGESSFHEQDQLWTWMCAACSQVTSVFREMQDHVGICARMDRITCPDCGYILRFNHEKPTTVPFRHGISCRILAHIIHVQTRPDSAHSPYSLDDLILRRRGLRDNHSANTSLEPAWIRMVEQSLPVRAEREHLLYMVQERPLALPIGQLFVGLFYRSFLGSGAGAGAESKSISLSVAAKAFCNMTGRSKESYLRLFSSIEDSGGQNDHFSRSIHEAMVLHVPSPQAQLPLEAAVIRAPDPDPVPAPAPAPVPIQTPVRERKQKAHEDQETPPKIERKDPATRGHVEWLLQKYMGLPSSVRLDHHPVLTGWILYFLDVVGRPPLDRLNAFNVSVIHWILQEQQHRLNIMVKLAPACTADEKLLLAFVEHYDGLYHTFRQSRESSVTDQCVRKCTYILTTDKDGRLRSMTLQSRKDKNIAFLFFALGLQVLRNDHCRIWISGDEI